MRPTLVVIACVLGVAASGSERKDWPVVVIGAGPGGVQTAHGLDRSGREFVVLERAAGAGSYFERYPRHRTLISINKRKTGLKDPEYQLRHDWNSLVGDDDARRFTNYTTAMWPHADVMPVYLNDFVAEHGLTHRFRFNTNVEKVSKRSLDGRFVIVTSQGTYTAEVLIVATGRWVPNIDKSISGWEHMEGYEDLDPDPAAYLDQAVTIVGTGNSAFETADAMEETAMVVHVLGRRHPRLSHWTHYPGDLRAVNMRGLDRYLLKSEEVIDSLDQDKPEDAIHLEVVKRDDGKLDLRGKYKRNEYVDASAWRRPFDRVIRCMGWRPDLSIFDRTAVPEMIHNGAFPRTTTAYESVNVSGLFFAGNLAHGRDYKKSSGGFVHGFRYTAAALPHLVAMRKGWGEWPGDDTACTVDALFDRVADRMRTASSMYQMFGFYGDVAVLSRPDGAVGPCRVPYYKDVPLEIMTSGVVLLGPRDATYLTLSMEWLPSFRGKQTIWHETQTKEEFVEEQRSFPLDLGDADHDHAALFGGALGSNPVRVPGKRPTWKNPKHGEFRKADQFLHPVLRLWKRHGKGAEAVRKPVLVSVHHVEEDVYTTWDHGETMLDPLSTWFNRHIDPLLW